MIDGTYKIAKHAPPLCTYKYIYIRLHFRSIDEYMLGILINDAAAWLRENTACILGGFLLYSYTTTYHAAILRWLQSTSLITPGATSRRKNPPMMRTCSPALRRFPETRRYRPGPLYFMLLFSIITHAAIEAIRPYTEGFSISCARRSLKRPGGALYFLPFLILRRYLRTSTISMPLYYKADVDVNIEIAAARLRGHATESICLSRLGRHRPPNAD